MGYDIKWGVCERVWVSRWTQPSVAAAGRPLALASGPARRRRRRQQVPVTRSHKSQPEASESVGLVTWKSVTRTRPGPALPGAVPRSGPGQPEGRGPEARTP